MKFKLEKISLNKYVLKNDQEKVVYNYKKNISSFGSKTFIYDENNLQLAELKGIMLSKIKYKIYINGTEFDNIVVTDKTPLEKYQLQNNKWIIEGDITYTDYKVVNEKNEILLTVKCDLVDTDIWDIDINTEEKVLAATLVMLIYTIAKK